jgi:multiple sugar transport system substrate-binding protein
MKKIIFGTMLVATLVSPLLVGCSSANSSSSNESSVPVSESSSASSQDLSGADLTYVNWNLGTADQNNLERQMVAAFNSKYNKNVKIVENVNTNAYEDALIAMAAKDQMPDVFMLTNTTFGLSNQYLADMTSYANADAAWAKIPSSVADSAKYKDKVYAIPFAIHMMGYFENEELLDSKNLASLSVSPKWDDFYNVVTTLNQPKNAIMGLNIESTLFEWYPAQLNASYGWYSFDGSQYHLDSTEFAKAMELTKTIRASKLTFDSLSAEERTSMGYDDSVAFWNDGKLGLRWGYTYEIPDMIAHSTFDKKFIGVPGARTPIVGDYLGISPTCKNPELAYQFAKWMSFDPDGIKQRLAFDSDGSLFSSLPLSTDADVISAYFDTKYNRIPGLEDVFRASNNGVVEGVKVIPGYGQSRWKARAGSAITIDVSGTPVTNPLVGQVIDQCWLGTINFADYSAGLNAIANKCYNDALTSFPTVYSAINPNVI